ncbi:MAG: hypothetical protein GSR84_03600 [Desulfurococcales archaeon]|nr:hypothetical protein [Desulfurococcales archaeon]
MDDEWPLLKDRPKGALRPGGECRGLVEACAEDLLRVEELPMDCVILVRDCADGKS